MSKLHALFLYSFLLLGCQPSGSYNNAGVGTLTVSSLTATTSGSLPDVDRWGTLNLTDTFDVQLNAHITRFGWQNEALSESEPLLPHSKIKVRTLLVVPDKKQSTGSWALDRENIECVSGWETTTEVGAHGEIQFPLAAQYLFSDGPQLEGRAYLILEVGLNGQTESGVAPTTLAVPFTVFAMQSSLTPRYSKVPFEEWKNACPVKLSEVSLPEAGRIQNSGQLFAAKGKPLPEAVDSLSLFKEKSGMPSSIFTSRSAPANWSSSLRSALAFYTGQLNGHRVDPRRARQIFSPLAREFCPLLKKERKNCASGLPLDYIVIEDFNFLAGTPKVLAQDHARDSLQLITAYMVETVQSSKVDHGLSSSEHNSSGNIGKILGFEAFGNGGGIFSTWTHDENTYVAVGLSRVQDERVRSRSREMGELSVQAKILTLEAPVRHCLRVRPARGHDWEPFFYCEEANIQAFEHTWYYIDDTTNFSGFFNSANENSRNNKWTTLMRGEDNYERFRLSLNDMVIELQQMPKHWQRTRDLYQTKTSASSRTQFAETFPQELGIFPGMISFHSTEQRP